MRGIDNMPIITGYAIQGAAGSFSMSGVAHYDLQATAWSALGAVTAIQWDRLEVRQRRAGEFEIEGFSASEQRSGIYTLTLGEVSLAPPSGRGAVPSDDAGHASLPVSRSPSRRESWAEWMPGAAATHTRSELAAAVNLELSQPITAAVIAEWERAGVLPIPTDGPGGPRYPEAASQAILLLIALDQTGRAHLDILEVVRNAAQTIQRLVEVEHITPGLGKASSMRPRDG